MLANRREKKLLLPSYYWIAIFFVSIIDHTVDGNFNGIQATERMNESANPKQKEISISIGFFKPTKTKKMLFTNDDVLTMAAHVHDAVLTPSKRFQSPTIANIQIYIHI